MLKHDWFLHHITPRTGVRGTFHNLTTMVCFGRGNTGFKEICTLDPLRLIIFFFFLGIFNSLWGHWTLSGHFHRDNCIECLELATKPAAYILNIITTIISLLVYLNCKPTLYLDDCGFLHESQGNPLIKITSMQSSSSAQYQFFRNF